MLEAESTFAHFKIIRRIGVGGMGEVFLAEDQKLHRRVALKVLKAEAFDSVERLDRFRREARTAAQVSHSNVMAIYDIDTAHDDKSDLDIHYIVMEYIEGVHLSEYLKTHQDISEVVKLAEKITSGLAAAHKLNIVHRDIKSENIIVDVDGEPKILDFGLAKPLDPIFSEEADESTRTASHDLTRVGKIMGTVAYMSPEQARGDTVDTRSDIFSFGVLLYRMVTGEFPFSGESQVSTLAKILEKRHESPRTKNENIPTEVERIIDKCLQKSPDDRYQDSRDLVVDLRNLRRQFDSGITDSVSSVFDRQAVKKSFWKTKGWEIAAGAGLILVIIVLKIAGVFDSGSSISPGGLVASENRLAILGFENKTGDEELDWLETGLPEILLTDLSQSEALHLISRERILDCFPDRKASHTMEECIDAAKSLGAVSILSGSFFKLGEKIRIDARLEDITTGRIILAEKVVGDDPFPLVDSLTEKIAMSLDIQESMPANKSVSTFASSSPEAYKYYHQGDQKFFEEFYEEAITNYEKAIELDSTFALPYLRLGMVNIFTGRIQLSIPYFIEAKKHEENLPPRERNLLDIYADIWLVQNFAEGFTKMKAFVRHYPDDKEARSIYALMINVFERDTATAFAHLDTVLMADPSYLFALDQYSSLKRHYGAYETAEDYAHRIIEHYPNSPSGYERLAEIYSARGLIDKAIAEWQKVRGIKPADVNILRELGELFVRKRDFKSASEYLELSIKGKEDDAYTMYGYYHSRANLANWEGKFVTGLGFRYKALEEALKTEDSNLVTGSYQSLASYCYRFDMPDSSLDYSRKGFKWTRTMQRLNYPLTIVRRFPHTAKVIRPVFEEALERFKAGVPSEFWIVTEKVRKVFLGRCDTDTTAIIEGLQELVDVVGGMVDRRANLRELARIQVEAGKFGEALINLEELTSSGQDNIVSYHFLINTYYYGRAHEGLGNKEEAIEQFQKVLEYWGDPELELKEISDTRTRLARLTS